MTAFSFVLALALVSAWPLFPVFVAAAAVCAYELWRRSIAGASAQRGPLGPFRLTAAAALLLVLVAVPSYGHDRAAAAYRTASAIRLPDPRRMSAGAVVAVLRAVDRVEHFDLARELPAPLAEVDLSDLAYRLWREGEEQAPSSTLIAYEVVDDSGQLRSRFSLIPEVDMAGTADEDAVLIERHHVAVVRRRGVLMNGAARWGRVTVSVADWPSWDPLPPRLEVYRRLVGGEATGPQTPRPVLALYGSDGSRRDEGPELPAGLLERARVSGRPQAIRLRFRGEELRGEVRPLNDGFQLVAIPGPDFLQRLLGATQLLAPAAFLYVAGWLVVAWRLVASGRPLRQIAPRGSRTFRGRLVALFVLSVMVPLFALTVFLRSSIATRSRRETLDHGRTALETARRVLDDYLPSAAAALGRLGLLDDTLLSWLANAVGYDLAVYSPEAKLVATSRRDLFAAGLLPERVPGATYVAIGLGAARERADTRLIAGSRFEEITTELSSVPGVPGVRSPVLLSLLLLPQQRVAEAEAGQLTAAVSAFSLLVFLISAAIAGRLAVRVARPVADLVEGTRAVARGDFSPHLAEPPDEELRELVRAFLFMSRSLKEQTQALSREKERLATLLSRLTAGVVAYREDGGVLLANPAAAVLGGGDSEGRHPAGRVSGRGDGRRAARPRARQSRRGVRGARAAGGRALARRDGAPAARRRRDADGRHRGRVRSRALQPARGLGRDGAHHRPRDQEPVDSHPPVRRASARSVEARLAGIRPRSRGVRAERSSPDRGPQALGRRVLRLCPGSDAADGGDRHRRPGAGGGLGLLGRARRPAGGRRAAGLDRPRRRAPARPRPRQPDRQLRGGARRRRRHPDRGAARR